MYESKVFFLNDVAQFPGHANVHARTHRHIVNCRRLILPSVGEPSRLDARECRFVTECRQVLSQQILDTLGSRIMLAIDDVQDSSCHLSRSRAFVTDGTGPIEFTVCSFGSSTGCNVSADISSGSGFLDSIGLVKRVKYGPRTAGSARHKRTSRLAPSKFALTRQPAFPTVPRCSFGQQAGVFAIAGGLGVASVTTLVAGIQPFVNRLSTLPSSASLETSTGRTLRCSDEHRS